MKYQVHQKSSRSLAFWLVFGAGVLVAVLVRDGIRLTAKSGETAAPLVAAEDLVYEGAFRLPQSVPGDSFSFGGSSLTYWDDHNSLLAVGRGQKVAEISIPPPVNSTDRSRLATATARQPFTDVLQGHRLDVDGDPANDAPIGGLLVVGNQVVVSVYRYYDGTGSESRSHFITGTDFSNLPPVRGPYQVGSFVPYPGGWTAGWMLPIPPNFRAAFGGAPYLTGQCCLSVVTRTSYGPSLSTFDPTRLGSDTPLGATRILGYDSGHQTLGGYESRYGDPGVLYHMTYMPGGVVFPVGTRSVLFFARQGTGPNCYGTGTADPALAGTKAPTGANYCVDPSNSDNGAHAWPYIYQVAAYDVNDLTAVYRGEKQFWQVRPYATWPMTMQYPDLSARITGVAYDAGRNRIFIGTMNGDVDQQNYSYQPMIHVFRLGTAAESCLR